MFISDQTFFHPGSEIFHPGSRIRIKEFKYFNPKKWFLSYRKYDLGCSSRIRIFHPSRISDPGVKKAPDPGSATLLPMRTYPVLAFLFLLLSEARLVGTSTKSVS